MVDKPLSLFTDGACRGNPGRGGAGAVLVGRNGEVIGTAKKFLGHCTNNIAEYRALILGLETALERGTPEISIYLDSELLVRQIQGIYRVKNPDLKPLMSEIRDLLDRFNSWKIEHVPRSDNALADRLANEAIDETLKNSA
ncbi:MAG TPA: ribonuclease HI family protein [Syntrophales bacterium]|nr:ribonuclease HI family protein [Syntrophales bacterium]